MTEQTGSGCRHRRSVEDESGIPGHADLFLAPGYATPLLEVDPPRPLVIANRSRADRNRRGLAYVAGVELPPAIMERKMLLGIKARAERDHLFVQRA